MTDTADKKPDAVWEAEAEKLRAEAAKSLAEARAADTLAALNEANAAKAVAEADKAVAEARGLDVQAEYNRHVEASAKIDRENKEHDQIKKLATDEYHHVYVFKEAVSSTSAGSCMSALRTWMRVDEHKPADQKAPIEICFNSPGGDVINGMALWDFIQHVRSEGHHITTSTIGYAASMAGILLQAGDVRVMGRESYLLIHEISFGAGGKIGEVEDEVEFVKKIQERVVAIFANRSHMTPAYIRKNWRRRDWWLDSTESLRLGLVDELR